MKLITVPNGRRVTIGAYVSTWRTLKAMPPRESVNGWQWYSVTVGEVLADFRHGVHDRINRRAGIVPPVDSPARQRRVARRLMDARNAQPCDCEWCGSLLPHWMPKHARFCDASCRRAYHL